MVRLSPPSLGLRGLSHGVVHSPQAPAEVEEEFWASARRERYVRKKKARVATAREEHFSPSFPQGSQKKEQEHAGLKAGRGG